MGRYLLLWEIDRTKIPLDIKERGIGFEMLLGIVNDDIKKGITKDWGAYVGEYKGYSVVEGTEVDVINQLERFSPFVIFNVHPIASVTNVGEMIKVMKK
jgi:hypothetical protein